MQLIEIFNQQIPKPGTSILEKSTSWKYQAKAIVSALRDARLHKVANEIANCSNDVIISQCDQKHEKVKTVFRCKQRFCLGCNYLKSAKFKRELISAIESLQEEYRGLLTSHVTFTLPTRRVEEVTPTLDRVNKAFGKLIKRKQFAKSLLGTFRGIHIKCYPADEMVSIHIHAVFVFKATFRSRKYITNSEWLRLWRESFQDPSITHIHVKPIMRWSRFRGHSTLLTVVPFISF